METPDKKPIYVFNGFFMAMRAKFVEPGELSSSSQAS
jgi:hypothetical protein